MKRFALLFFILMLFSLSAWAQDYDLLFYQPYYDGGSALTSAVDSANDMNYEVADNFSEIEEEISQVVVYGFCGLMDGGFIPTPPEATEPLIIRFYGYEEGIFPGLFATTSGEYSVELYDDYGDGWNGAALSLFVNNEILLEDITLVDGEGPEVFTFTVSEGDMISTVFTEGDWAYECYYRILDEAGNMIAEDGGTIENQGASTPEGILPAGTPVAPEPDWENPLFIYEIDATTEQIGYAWGGSFPLYRLVAELETPVALTHGWVSVQMNADAGSGVCFAWLNSLIGDGVSHQIEHFGRNLCNEPEKELRSIKYRTSDNSREENSEDLSLELWGGTLSTPPPCALMIFPFDGMINVVAPYILSWSTSPIADGCKINFGTDNPPSNIENNTDIGNVTQFEIDNLSPDTQYYWQIVPYNDFGDATDCPIWTFTTATSGYVFIGDHQSTLTNPALPICVSWENSLSEVLYRAEWLETQGVVGGYLTKISFFYNFVEDSPGIPVNIWIGETELEELPPEWIPAGELTPVYTGMVDFFTGEHEIEFNLTPYDYRGDNLIVMIQRPVNQTMYAWDNQFYATGLDEEFAVSFIDISDDVVLDPYSPTPVEYYLTEVPNTALFFGEPAYGTLTGFVTSSETNQPIAGAEISVSGVTTTTSANGAYTLDELVIGNHSVTCTKDGYAQQTVNDVIIEEDEVRTLNFVLDPLALLPPTALSYTLNDNDVILNWSDPYGNEYQLFESFETTFPPLGWTTVNPDGGTGWSQIAVGTTPFPGWNVGVVDPAPNGGDFIAFCTWNTGGQSSNDQWFITPQITVEENSVLSFDVVCWLASEYLDNLDILISTNSQTNTNDFNIVIEEIAFDSTEDEWWVTKNYQLSNYVATGTPVYIAFREHIEDNFANGAFVAIDNVIIGNSPRSACPVKETSLYNGTKDLNHEYTSSIMEVQRNERDLLSYNIYRNNELITTVPLDVLSYSDMNLPGGTYTYFVTAVYTEDESVPSNTVTVNIVQANDNHVSYITDLKGNYPNPFNPVTFIDFSLENPGKVNIEIYNLKGQKVKSLVNDSFAAGRHSIEWNGKDDNKRVVTSGIYLYKMTTDRYTSTKKMLLLK